MEDNQDKPTRFQQLAKRVKQEFTYNGGLYSVNEICDALESGLKPRDALAKLYPTTPKLAYPQIIKRLKKHPYYLARQDLQLNVLKEEGARLQMNLLDLAYNSKSEMVRFSATDSALDRVYGEKDGDKGSDESPKLVFNFNLGGGQTVTKTVEDGTIIDQ